MNFINRFGVFTKRIFTRKTYILMLALIITLTGIYVLLPEKKQSSSIRVAICCDYETEYVPKVLQGLEDINTMYEFYEVSSKDSLLNDVKSGYAHCGFYIPENFFENYIAGNYDTPMTMYDTPSSTLSSAISETLFSCILKVCAPEILTTIVNIPEYNQELRHRITEYLYGDDVFTIESLTGGTYNFLEETYKINIPVYEISVILIIFSALLGLLVYMQDAEKNIYVALSGKETSLIKLTGILTAILPIMVTSLLCLLIIGNISNILGIICLTFIAITITFLLSFIIRKSTLLLKVLPLILLVSIVLVFMNNLI